MWTPLCGCTPNNHNIYAYKCVHIHKCVCTGVSSCPHARVCRPVPTQRTCVSSCPHAEVCRPVPTHVCMKAMHFDLKTGMTYRFFNQNASLSCTCAWGQDDTFEIGFKSRSHDCFSQCAFVSRADYDALRFMTHCVAFITRLRSAFVFRVRFVFLNASARLALAFVEISFQFSFEVVFLMQVQVMFFLKSAFNFRLRSSF